ncbi:MAG: peptidyl-prolyl cis-trans isomerase, partial [Alphaproteobacteria bacterium]
QIPFPDVKAAQAAYEKIQAGASFEEVAKENKVTDEDLNLGTLSKAEMLDPVVADVAFSLTANEVSKPVEGQLSTVLLRVAKIEPERVTPFEEAKDQIRRKLARERAIQEISDLYGKIEDERAAGTPLDEIAKQLGLPYRIIPAVDRQGKDPDGKKIDPPLPEQFRVLSEAFVSDVGLEADPVETQDQGLVWFDVLEIFPPKVRPLAEIRDRVAADWKENEQRARLAARARALVERLRKGEDIGTVAQELGLEVKESKPLKRSDATDELPATAVTQAFALRKGGYGSASSQEGKARVVFQVIGIKDPDPPSREAAEALEKSLQPQLAGDLLEQFVSGLTREYGVTRNQQLI